jgi:hypothetical protein
MGGEVVKHIKLSIAVHTSFCEFSLLHFGGVPFWLLHLVQSNRSQNKLGSNQQRDLVIIARKKNFILFLVTLFYSEKYHRDTVSLRDIFITF